MNGHEKLIADVEELLGSIKLFLFHDFKSDLSATPKMLLVNILNQLITNTKTGKYDNEPEEDDLEALYSEDGFCEEDFKND